MRETQDGKEGDLLHLSLRFLERLARGRLFNDPVLTAIAQAREVAS